ncbi:type II toxin-antitoxin system VapC family toxin [Novosphingobium sp. PASSN1]|uniref:type II toxin-antitoxin system VapC family toxin n=1 Tax=Novosphingobium sp. PASSN1 TaxID=2015561 RepID=UPI000BC8E7F6|nr:type II toxin-antitoxin system VapC family toxin [Novosphingobium sp. PASSN1]OYU34349.1 MAG: VapC toxin family PIN domain ribonuclease [Novosphingobium sp. PASSN1]
MSEVVLDASALLALLHDEPGASKVADVLAGGRICAVNLAEVVSHFIHLGMPAHEVDAMLHPLPINVIAADDGLARIAGRLRGVTASAGLSLGDRFCLALAERDGLPALTADKQWRTFADAVAAKIVVIR